MVPSDLIVVVSVIAYFANAAPFDNQRNSFGIVDPVLGYDHSSVGVGELGEYFEGDMLLTEDQKKAIESNRDGTQRNGLIDTTARWPNRTVVYRIVEKDFSESQIEMIKEGMKDLESKSCIRFRQRRTLEHAVTIQGSENGCFSSVGANNDLINKVPEMLPPSVMPTQVLNLGKGCFRHGTIVHEMLHTLGFYHMQSAYDRDDYVRIIWKNILSGREHNFDKYDNKTITDFGVRYDYGSVMHYPEYAFSKNGERTIIPLEDDVTIGQRIGLSKSDVLKLNRMYKCKDSGTE